MAKKTFIPTLVLILHRVCTYIVRWNTQLRRYLTPEQEALLDAVYLACQAFTNSIDPEDL